jgi:NAD(P)-dependent dehydrogenase (short-subunit alcohol dehydrogenase family)
MSGSGKVALVTGANAGIGKASALALVKAGYRVVFTGRRLELLEQAVKDSGAPAGEALAVRADVGDPESVKALFAKTKEKFGRLDVLFNNAGMGAPAVPMEELAFEKWRDVVAANLTGTFLCCQEAVKIMKAQDPKGGRIINNGSISAHAPRPMSIAYTATKHGVTGITKTLSLDLRKHDIAVCQIDIGNAATEMTERMTKGVMQANGEIAVEPRMDVKHVASAVVYMAGLPLEANVQFMTIMATKMPFVGRG